MLRFSGKDSFQLFLAVSCPQSAEPDKSFLPCALDRGVLSAFDFVTLLLQSLQKTLVVLGLFSQNVIDYAAEPGAQVLHIGSIDPAIFIGYFGVLVQIVTAHLQKIRHAAQLRQIQIQTISVQRHLAQIGANAQNAARFHLVPNPFQLRLADSEMELLVAAVAHRASPSLS